MADIDAGRPAELAMDLGLERQQCQNQVDRAAHGRRPARSPYPNGRRDIFHDRETGQAPAHARGDSVGEVGRIDKDEHIGRRGRDRRDGLAQPSQDGRKPGQDRADPDGHQVPDRKKTCQARFTHARPADTAERHRALLDLRQRVHQTSAEEIARGLAGDQKHSELSRLAGTSSSIHNRSPDKAGTPTTNSRARSAACATRSGSAMIVPPATAATPARPARATPSIVCGPIEGRSNRRSCPCFGALTRTPTLSRRLIRPCRRSTAMRSSMLSVPSAASTAKTCLPATITPWPTSNAPVACSNASPWAISVWSRSEGWPWPSAPSGTRISGATSWGPMNLNP